MAIPDMLFVCLDPKTPKLCVTSIDKIDSTKICGRRFRPMREEGHSLGHFDWLRDETLAICGIQFDIYAGYEKLRDVLTGTASAYACQAGDYYRLGFGMNPASLPNNDNEQMLGMDAYESDSGVLGLSFPIWLMYVIEYNDFASKFSRLLVSKP